MRDFVRTALSAAILATFAGPTLAQDIPPGQTCGGLFCDIGLVGHKVPLGPNGEPPTPAQVAAVEEADPHRLPCHDFLCRAFGQKDADAAPAPPPPAPVAMAEPAQPVKHSRRTKHKTAAKAETPPAPAAAAPPAGAEAK